MSTSAERRWAERRYILEESTTLNGGTRTVSIEHMPPNTTVFPHWHNRFSETFDLISGTMNVYSCDTPDLDALEASSQTLEIGNHTTIPPGLHHKYQCGDKNTVLRAILTPGHRYFERLLMIMNGLAEDGELNGLSDNVVVMVVLLDLADAHPIGSLAELAERTRKEKGQDIARLKEKLLGK